MQKVSLDVLIIEEDKHWRQIFQQELERLGAKTTVADSSIAALNLARKKNYDMYISGGIMFCHRLKEIRPDANILLVPGQYHEMQYANMPQDVSYITKGQFSKVIYNHVQTSHEKKTSKGKA